MRALLKALACVHATQVRLGGHRAFTNNTTFTTTNNGVCKVKKLMSVVEVEGEGLLSLLGEPVILFCMNYFYAGTLAGVNADCVLLEDGGIVYETGTFSDKQWKDFQKIGNVYVRIASIEAYAKGK